MRFWDTSALVPLLLEQEATRDVEEFLAKDPDIAAWWGTPVECRSSQTTFAKMTTIIPRATMNSSL